MIIWNEITYNIEKAEQDYNDFTIDKLRNAEADEKYTEIRDSLIDARDRMFEEHGFDTAEKLGYDFDLTFGLEIYDIFVNKYNFNTREASDDNIWRFLQLRVIPDIVYSRWDMNPDRFFRISRRLWLKTIWWYIHLSWNQDKEHTYELLKNNTTDTIMQLVERPGLGYNIELYREIMKKYGEVNDGSQRSRMLFRKVLIMNTARSMVISPELVQGGVTAYVGGIFNDVINWG